MIPGTAAKNMTLAGENIGLLVMNSTSIYIFDIEGGVVTFIECMLCHLFLQMYIYRHHNESPNIFCILRLFSD